MLRGEGLPSYPTTSYSAPSPPLGGRGATYSFGPWTRGVPQTESTTTSLPSMA
jgi:hypothetical protein